MSAETKTQIPLLRLDALKPQTRDFILALSAGSNETPQNAVTRMLDYAAETNPPTTLNRADEVPVPAKAA